MLHQTQKVLHIISMLCSIPHMEEIAYKWWPALYSWSVSIEKKLKIIHERNHSKLCGFLFVKELISFTFSLDIMKILQSIRKINSQTKHNKLAQMLNIWSLHNTDTNNLNQQSTDVSPSRVTALIEQRPLQRRYYLARWMLNADRGLLPGKQRVEMYVRSIIRLKIP